MTEKCTHKDGHVWKIFKDPKLIGSGELSFFCQHCLALKKVKKTY